MDKAKGGGSKAVFLDRDGTLNRDFGYVSRKEDWEWIPGSVEALRHLKAQGYRLVLATNQSGIARGYCTESDVRALHETINEELSKAGCPLDAVYLCPHHPSVSGECFCRKPRPGMLRQAAIDLEIDLKRSWMVGDSSRDVEAGLLAGCRSVLLTGSDTGETEAADGRLFYAGDLLAFARALPRLDRKTGALPW